jgi:hypothetical protein
MKLLRVLLGVVLLSLALTLASAQGTVTEHPSYDAKHLAVIATAMVDGDLCQHIVTDRAVKYLLRSDPHDPWADADNYDVDAATFQQVKSTLLRIAMLANDHTALNLWLPVPNKPDAVQIVVRLRPGISGLYDGSMMQPMPGAMRHVMATGEQSESIRQKGAEVILAPVHDSLGRTVAVVEVAERIGPDPGTKGDTE